MDGDATVEYVVGSGGDGERRWRRRTTGTRLPRGQGRARLGLVGAAAARRGSQSGRRPRQRARRERGGWRRDAPGGAAAEGSARWRRARAQESRRRLAAGARKIEAACVRRERERREKRVRY
jgi:hypothetical protein